jgi:hypothetical protein
MPCNKKRKELLKQTKKEMEEHPQLNFPMAKRIAQQHLKKKKR